MMEAGLIFIVACGIALVSFSKLYILVSIKTGYLNIIAYF